MSKKLKVSKRKSKRNRNEVKSRIGKISGIELFLHSSDKNIVTCRGGIHRSVKDYDRRQNSDVIRNSLQD